MENNNRINNEDFITAHIGRRDDILSLIPKGARTVLDVGCSIGTSGERIKQEIGAEVTGIEYDEKMARVAETKLDKVILGDLDHIELREYLNAKYFDCIIFADVLEHIKDPWGVLKSSIEFLKDDGIIIASIPNIRHYTSIMNLTFRGYWPYRKRGLHDRQHLRFFTLKNIKELYEDAGLEIISLKRKYRIIEKPHSYNRFAKYVAIPLYFFRDFLVFQYLIVLRKK